MPEIDEAFFYLVEWINELGFCSSNGMGATAISFLEMKAWSDLMGNDLNHWEAKVLRDMSSAFVSMQETAKKPDCEDPAKALSTGN